MSFLRIAFFFVAVIFLTGLLARVPVLGAIFQIPFLGFWFTAILLSAFVAKLGNDAVDHRARRNLEKSLGAVDTPHHKGKLGALLLSQGRAKKAVPLFESAVQGDPSSLEWRYRLGLALVESRGDMGAALGALDSVLEEDDEYGFGSAMLLSARAALGAGYDRNALERAERFEHDHGPTPESALLRARIHKSLGDRAAMGAALDEIPALVKTASRRGGPRGLSLWLRALMLRLLP